MRWATNRRLILQGSLIYRVRSKVFLQSINLYCTYRLDEEAQYSPGPRAANAGLRRPVYKNLIHNHRKVHCNNY